MDPVRGHSPWQRGVRGNEQVLICPTCQGIHDWKTDLDPCGRCGSVRLVRRLGEAECRDCGYVATPEAVAVPAGVAVTEGAAVGGGVARSGEVATVTGTGAGRDDEVPCMSGAEAPGLSEEVERALERVLGRGPVGG
ncbi:MAG TPA: hypothetical protein VH642_13740 [Streptosporangiaceae bacterium]